MVVAALTLAIVCLAVAACSSGDEELVPSSTIATRDANTPTPQIAPTVCFAGELGCPTVEPTSTGDPVLTADQERAKQIALADPVVAGVLGDAEYRVTGVGDLTIHGEVIGGDVTIALDQPLMVDADLPFIDAGFRGGDSNPTQIELPPPYYIDGTTHITVDDTKSLFVSVDLNRGKVIQVIAAPF